MLELGIILIGTGLIIIGSAKAMIRSTTKMTRRTSYYNDVEDLETQQKNETKTEEEFKGLVKRSMRILYVVGITCMALGVLLIVFGA